VQRLKKLTLFYSRKSLHTIGVSLDGVVHIAFAQASNLLVDMISFQCDVDA